MSKRMVIRYRKKLPNNAHWAEKIGAEYNWQDWETFTTDSPPSILRIVLELRKEFPDYEFRFVILA